MQRVEEISATLGGDAVAANAELALSLTQARLPATIAAGRQRHAICSGSPEEQFGRELCPDRGQL